MATYPIRLKYNELQFLREPDFSDEQLYHRTMRYQHNRRLHTKGIAYGMTVTKSTDKKVMVSSGMAIDGVGRDIVLFEGEEVDLAPFNKANITSYFIISFGEQDTDSSIPDPNPEIRNRSEEKPAYNLVDVKPVASDIDVWLAEIDFDSNGIITAVRDITTLEDIPDSGARIADSSVSFDKLDTMLQMKLNAALKPEITNFDPPYGHNGTATATEVTITGKNFFEPVIVEFTAPGNARVKADTTVTFVDSPQKIRAKVPAGHTDGPIYVTTEHGEAKSVDDFGAV